MPVRAASQRRCCWPTRAPRSQSSSARQPSAADPATIEAQTAQGRFHFDIGPTFFLYPRVLADIFASCGRRLEDAVELIRLDPHYDLIFEEPAASPPAATSPRLQRSVAEVAPGRGDAIPAFMADNRAKLAAFRPVLESPFNGFARPADAGRAEGAADAAAVALGRLRPASACSRTRGCGSASRSRASISACRRIGVPACSPSWRSWNTSSASSTRAAAAVPSCGRWRDAARRLGVRVPARRAGAELLFEGRRAVGVRTEAGEHPRRRRGGERRFRCTPCSTWCRTACAGAGPTASIAKARSSPAPPSCSISASRATRRNWRTTRSIWRTITAQHRRDRGRAGRRRPSRRFYVQNACVTDPALAPPGHSTLYVLVPVGHERSGHRLGRPSAPLPGRCAGPAGAARGARRRATHTSSRR